MAIGILGDTSFGSLQAAMIELLDSMNSDELSQFASIAELCSFGPATGPARASHCLAAVATSPPPLRLRTTVADSRFRKTLSLLVQTEKSSSIV